MNRILAVVAIALVLGAGSALAAACCNHNSHTEQALHGTIVHVDKISAPHAHNEAGHCRSHGCTHPTPGHSEGNHAEVHCQHDMAHNAYCAKNCSAHQTSCTAACNANEHAKDCGDTTGVQGDARHACGRDCDKASQKCAHCGHSHCGNHAWGCHTSHHHVVSTHSCSHHGCKTHCHTDGLRPELRAKVEEVRQHNSLR